jgi:hypothetical protein
MVCTNFPYSLFGLIPYCQKVSLVNVNDVTMVSSLSPSTPSWSGNQPPSTPDSDKTNPLPSPLQQFLVGTLQCTTVNLKNLFLVETFHVNFGFQHIRSVKTLSLPCTG